MKNGEGTKPHFSEKNGAATKRLFCKERAKGTIRSFFVPFLFFFIKFLRLLAVKNGKGIASKLKNLLNNFNFFLIHSMDKSFDEITF